MSGVQCVQPWSPLEESWPHKFATRMYTTAMLLFLCARLAASALGALIRQVFNKRCLGSFVTAGHTTPDHTYTGDRWCRTREHTASACCMQDLTSCCVLSSRAFVKSAPSIWALSRSLLRAGTWGQSGLVGRPMLHHQPCCLQWLYLVQAGSRALREHAGVEHTGA